MLKFATPTRPPHSRPTASTGCRWRSDRGRDQGLDLARRIPTGIVHINEQTIDDEPNVPFGGMLASGTSARFGGTANLDAFTETRWVTMRGDIARLSLLIRTAGPCASPRHVVSLSLPGLDPARRGACMQQACDGPRRSGRLSGR